MTTKGFAQNEDEEDVDVEKPGSGETIPPTR
jgi:hypothetical protein